jgi:endonuclease/exonuclease/phosphatase family metal-dependent hydrolase
MRILSFNVQSCRAGLERVADVIRRAGPDVAALNEVRRGQARRLGRLLGMHVAFGATLRRYGNALLTKERPSAVRAAGFTIASGEPRGFVTVTLPEGLVVATVHLGLTGDERVAQAGELVAALAGAENAVVAGDLNEEAGGLAVRVVTSRLRDAFGDEEASSGFTFPSEQPSARIDYVFVSDGIRVTKASVLQDVASDHLAVIADLGIG